MESASLLLVCVSAFIAVFILLSALALVMRALMALFPEPGSEDDSAQLAAIAVATSAAYPGMKVTSVEEEKK